MRASSFASIALMLAAVACGSRTPFEDADAGPSHNETLTGGFGAGATTSAGGTNAAGTTASIGKGGGVTSAGGASVATGGAATAGSGTAGAGAVGTGGSKATGGTGAAGSTTTGKGGTGGTGNGGTSSSTGGTGAGAFGGACDAAKQTGCSPKQKCSAEQQGMGNLNSSCVPLTGSNAEGTDCMRQKIGFDNCAAGLICTGVGVVDYDPNKMPPHRQCRKLCAQDADCGKTQACSGFTQDGFGVCIDICIPFSACDPATTTDTGVAGNNGGATVSCSDIIGDVDQSNAYFTCHKVGKGTSGAQCSVSQDCAAGYFCQQGQGPMGGACTQLCNADHPCDGKGLSCASTTPTVDICQLQTAKGPRVRTLSSSEGASRSPP
jgi:hypothetical protein